MAMLSREAIEQIGFAAVGENVLILDRASFYGVDRIALGNIVRINGLCVLLAGDGQSISERECISLFTVR